MNKQTDIEEMRKACELDPINYRLLSELAAIEQDRNKKREALEKAIELNDDFAPAICDLGNYYRRHNRPPKAKKFYDMAVEKDPSYYPARMGLARYFDENHLPGKAEEICGKLLKDFSPTVAILSFRTGFHPYPETLAESKEEYLDLLEYKRSDLVTRQALAYIYLNSLKVDKAIEQFDMMLETEPDFLPVLLIKAAILHELDREHEAMAVLREYLAISPEDPEAHELIGECHLALGEKEQAMASWQLSLEIDPHDPDLREHMELLMPREEAFEEKYKVDAFELKETAPDAAERPLDSAIYLADLTVRNIHPGGQSDIFRQKVIKVFNEKGARDAKYFPVTYSPHLQEVDIKSARVIKPDGEIIEAMGPYQRAISNPEGGLYYNYVMKAMIMPKLEPGDIVEMSYRINSITSENMYGGHFGAVYYLRGSLPKQRASYILIAPKDKALQLNPVGITAEPETQIVGEKKISRWDF
ncbi:MAG: DUF3857 domain-containing protein, partial [Thermoplasmata archaeon]|nr:DUF3857 domain-containing protein [Thermoplasmata archaeon]